MISSDISFGRCKVLIDSFSAPSIYYSLFRIFKDSSCACAGRIHNIFFIILIISMVNSVHILIIIGTCILTLAHFVFFLNLGLFHCAHLMNDTINEESFFYQFINPSVERTSADAPSLFSV